MSVNHHHQDNNPNNRSMITDDQHMKNVNNNLDADDENMYKMNSLRDSVLDTGRKQDVLKNVKSEISNLISMCIEVEKETPLVFEDEHVV